MGVGAQSGIDYSYLTPEPCEERASSGASVSLSNQRVKRVTRGCFEQAAVGCSLIDLRITPSQ